MKRLLPLALLVLVPAPSTALADGCPPVTCGTTSAAVPGSPTLLVRPSGREGPAKGYDLSTGAQRFSLPSGVLAADGRTFVSSLSRKGSRRTTLSRYDARTGRLLGRSSMPGRWGAVAVSASGRSLALLYGRQHGVVIGVADRTLRSRTVLNGNFQVDALSPDGRRVFLVHWSRTGAYDLQQLDTRTGRRTPTRLDDPEEKMTGTAMNAVATRDGHWLLTLYVKAGGGGFVHALDLRTGIAHCIDLPLRGDLTTLGATTLALSPDERTLYLASPLLGRVTTVDLGELQVNRVVQFDGIRQQNYVLGIGPNAAVTRNGRMLAFSAGRTVWLYDTVYGVVHRPIRSGETILGIGFRPDGRRVLAILAGGHVAFDASTGERARNG